MTAADPRYIHDRALPFTTPPDLANGALSGDKAQLVAYYVAARKAMNLPYDEERVARLISAAGAIDQVREFGIVLEKQEIDALRRSRIIEAQIDAIALQHEHAPWFGGTRFVGVHADPQFILYSTQSGAETARRVITEMAPTTRVRVDIVRSSLTELEQTTEQLRNTIKRRGAGSGAVVNRELKAVGEGLAADPDIVDVEYSISDNEVHVLTQSSSTRRDMLLDGLPRIRFKTIGKTTPHYQDPCDANGCNSQRGEVQIQSSNGHLSSSPSVSGIRSMRAWISPQQVTAPGESSHNGPSNFPAGRGGDESWLYATFFPRTRAVYPESDLPW